jgi:hypothetical protein
LGRVNAIPAFAWVPASMIAFSILNETYCLLGGSVWPRRRARWAACGAYCVACGAYWVACGACRGRR